MPLGSEFHLKSNAASIAAMLLIFSLAYLIGEVRATCWAGLCPYHVNLVDCRIHHLQLQFFSSGMVRIMLANCFSAKIYPCRLDEGLCDRPLSRLLLTLMTDNLHIADALLDTQPVLAAICTRILAG